MEHALPQSEQSPLIAEAHEMDWTPDRKIPDGVTVENMRRRGIDQLEITLYHPEAHVDRLRRLGIFGRRKPRVATVTFAEDHALFVIPDRFAAESEETLVERKDISAIEVVKGTVPMGPTLDVSIGQTKLNLGYGLSRDAIDWLRERLVLECAGLVSRPLFNVGRRITRKTSNPDDDFYTQWPPGPNRLLSVFLEEFPKQAKGLKQSIETQEWTTAARQCHWMKSSAAAVGAAQLSELCQRMEIDVITDDYSKIESIHVHFDRELTKVSDSLTRTINGTPEADETSVPLHASAAASEASADLKGRKILLVEDSLVNQEVARFSLEEAGCETFIASDGKEAVELFQQDRYDLILMDCQMPVMDGYEATKIIRQIELTNFLPPTPIIALTANALRDDREACVAAGMHDYLSKPYEEHDLMELLLKWLPADLPAREEPAELMTA